MSENGEGYNTGKKFTLPPAVTALTNLTSVHTKGMCAKTKLSKTGNSKKYIFDKQIITKILLVYFSLCQFYGLWVRDAVPLQHLFVTMRGMNLK